MRLKKTILQIAVLVFSIPLASNAAWYEDIKMKGDFRYRHETIDDDSKSDTRNRHRIRFRLGLKAEVNDNTDFHLRLASAGSSGDPVSRNVTLDSGNSSKDIDIDMAYFDYKPELSSGKIHIQGGKLKNPFYRPIKDELLWDGDLTPEGIALKYKSEEGTFWTNLTGWWIEESSSGDDATMLGAQAGVSLELGEAKLILGGGYLDYEEIEGQSTIFEDEEGFGNTLSADGKYVFDYNIFEFFGELKFKIADEVPVSVFGHYANNDEASSEDTGISGGFKIGKAKEPGQWDFKFIYKDIEADSVLGVFTDSDFGGGGTDHEGWEAGIGFVLAESWWLKLSHFDNDKNENSKGGIDFQRTMVDLVFKF